MEILLGQNTYFDVSLSINCWAARFVGLKTQLFLFFLFFSIIVFLFCLSPGISLKQRVLSRLVVSYSIQAAGHSLHQNKQSTFFFSYLLLCLVVICFIKETSEVKVFTVLFINQNFTQHVPAHFFLPLLCNFWIVFFCLLPSEFPPSPILLSLLFSLNSLLPLSPFVVLSFLFTSQNCDISQTNRPLCIPPHTPYIENKLDSLFPLTDWYRFLFQSEGNIISTHKWSLNSVKATGRKFVLRPVFHSVPLKSQIKNKKQTFYGLF